MVWLNFLYIISQEHKSINSIRIKWDYVCIYRIQRFLGPQIFLFYQWWLFCGLLATGLLKIGVLKHGPSMKLYTYLPRSSVAPPLTSCWVSWFVVIVKSSAFYKIQEQPYLRGLRCRPQCGTWKSWNGMNRMAQNRRKKKTLLDLHNEMIGQ